MTIFPTNLPFTATSTSVPKFSFWYALKSTFCASISFLLPQRTTPLLSSARIPCPAISSTFDGLSIESPFSSAASTMLFPIGCVEDNSQLALIANKSLAVIAFPAGLAF